MELNCRIIRKYVKTLKDSFFHAHTVMAMDAHLSTVTVILNNISRDTK